MAIADKTTPATTMRKLPEKNVNCKVDPHTSMAAKPTTCCQTPEKYCIGHGLFWKRTKANWSKA